ncbi:MAG: type II secretion system protein GspM [Pseudomonadota bacterium]
MTDWWNNLSERERVIVGGAGAVAALVLLFQFLVVPVNGWRTDAAASAERAQQGYRLATNAASVGASAQKTPAARNDTPLRQALTQSAAAAGIDLVRLGAEVGGQIEVQPAPLSPDLLYEWIATLQSRYGVAIAFADVSRSDEGNVNVQVLVFERDAAAS